MTAFPILLADEITDAILASWRTSDPATRERVYIFGAIGVVTLLVLIWATFLRKRRRRRHEHHHAQHASSRAAEAAETAAPGDAAAPIERRRHRRRAGRRHRPRNPTLAETGGLPPIRPEDPPEAEA